MGRSETYSPECVGKGFWEVGSAFLAKTLLNSAVGQPRGKQTLG